MCGRGSRRVITLTWSRGTRRRKRRRLAVVLVMLGMVASAIGVWVKSYSTQYELRSMRRGVHRHIEVARGRVTFVTTTGWSSADYWEWAISPDLAHHREAAWPDMTRPTGTATCVVTVPLWLVSATSTCAVSVMLVYPKVVLRRFVLGTKSRLRRRSQIAPE
jgi:hypothetical protein